MSSKSRRAYNPKGPSQRQLRVAESLRHALSKFLMREDFFDPDLANVDNHIRNIDQPGFDNCACLHDATGGVQVETVLPASIGWRRSSNPWSPKRCICDGYRAYGFA